MDTGARVDTWPPPGVLPGQRRPPSIPRRRRRVQALLGAVVILAGGLGGLLLVGHAGDRFPGIVITARVPADQPIPLEAIGQVQVAPDPGVEYVGWSQRRELDRLHARSDLLPGTVLVAGMLTAEEPVRDGRVVGLSLREGHYPAELAVGDQVDAVLVTEGAGEQPAVPVLASGARVYSIGWPGGPGPGAELAVSVLVAEAEAVALARAAASGDVALTLVPAG